ncbi:MAG: hypothetical protein IOC52_06525 [Methylobacterium sp.]|nr:hypothetical protein [Methylobacterium sp.]MCA3623817.1 hypothetical protein [Methylobacterium sp.]
MNRSDCLQQAFNRFGVTISAAEVAGVSRHAPHEAILVLLANREIAARFDAAHGRPPEEADLEALLEVYEAAARKA